MSNYHELACTMATYPKLAIFKKFQTANIRNLLILQAEIIFLEHQLGKTIKENRCSSDNEIRELEKCVFKLQRRKPGTTGAKQWNRITRLRTRLREYNAALLQMQSILRLPSAYSHDLATLRRWLPHAEGGQAFLHVVESKVWDQESDLTSLGDNSESKDVVSKWINGSLAPWFFRRVGHRLKKHQMPVWDPTLTEKPTQVFLDRYPDSSVLVTIISTVFASILPTLSIFALYYVTSPVLRLGMITAFTSFFSLTFAVFGNAKRSDCFAATAAFSAVLVVFVGSTTDSSKMS